MGCGCGGGGSTSSNWSIDWFPCCEPEVMPPNVICDACSVNDFEF